MFTNTLVILTPLVHTLHHQLYLSQAHNQTKFIHPFATSRQTLCSFLIINIKCSLTHLINLSLLTIINLYS